MDNLDLYVKSTYFINSDHPDIVSLTKSRTGHCSNNREKVIALFEHVRDSLFYDPYHLDLRPQTLVASNILQRRSAYCIEKAILLCAVLRAANIPARLNFGNVRNHIAMERILSILKTDMLVFHGCTEVFLDNRWIKLTPAFNRSLCEKIGVPVLNFNGMDDAVFQQYNEKGDQFMEYLLDYGSFEDMPYGKMLSSLKEHYPHIPIPENLILNLNDFKP